MKVRVLSTGGLVDFSVPEASRLLANGRAVLPDVDVTVPAPVEAVTSTEVHDTGLVRTFRRRRR